MWWEEVFLDIDLCICSSPFVDPVSNFFTPFTLLIFLFTLDWISKCQLWELWNHLFRLVWSPHTKRNISNLEQVQCRATGFILGRDYLAHEHLNKWNLLPLPYHSEINDLVYFFKCFKNIHMLISSIVYCSALVSNHWETLII